LSSFSLSLFSTDKFKPSIFYSFLVLCCALFLFFFSPFYPLRISSFLFMVGFPHSFLVSCISLALLSPLLVFATFFFFLFYYHHHHCFFITCSLSHPLPYSPLSWPTKYKVLCRNGIRCAWRQLQFKVTQVTLRLLPHVGLGKEWHLFQYNCTLL
jgi:hypothetical protein